MENILQKESNCMIHLELSLNCKAIAGLSLNL